MAKVEFLPIFKVSFHRSTASKKLAGSNHPSNRSQCTNSANTGVHITSNSSFANHTYYISYTQMPIWRIITRAKLTALCNDLLISDHHFHTFAGHDKTFLNYVVCVDVGIAPRSYLSLCNVTVRDFHPQNALDMQIDTLLFSATFTIVSISP